MFIPEPAEIVGYDNGIPVTRVTRHGGGTFVDLYATNRIYSRRVYRGGGAQGSREEEAEIIASLDPVRPGGQWRLVLGHRLTELIDGSLDELREAIVQVDDERVPRVEGSTLNTLAGPSLWCDEWDKLWKDAMWEAPLVFSERLEAEAGPEIRRALQRVDMAGILRPDPTATLTVVLPPDVEFNMVLQLRRQCVHNEGRQATHLPVLREGLPKQRFIAGLLQLRERIIHGDRQAQELLMAACGEVLDLPVLLEADQSDMIAALLALRIADSGDTRAAARLEEFDPPWAAYAEAIR